MTVCPDKPRLAPTCVDGVMELTDGHMTVVPLWLGFELVVVVKPGYATDGASVPERLQPAFGGPWDMPRLLAALVHDALYSRRWKCRWLCDIIYRKILMNVGYPADRLALEYAAIRADGWKSWKAVNKEEVKLTKTLTSVEVRRSR